jgi:hypothetical protein
MCVCVCVCVCLCVYVCGMQTLSVRLWIEPGVAPQEGEASWPCEFKTVPFTSIILAGAHSDFLSVVFAPTRTGAQHGVLHIRTRVCGDHVCEIGQYHHRILLLAEAGEPMIKVSAHHGGLHFGTVNAEAKTMLPVRFVNVHAHMPVFLVVQFTMTPDTGCVLSGTECITLLEEAVPQLRVRRAHGRRETEKA